MTENTLNSLLPEYSEAYSEPVSVSKSNEVMGFSWEDF